MMIQREAEVKNRVRAVAMTDSVHNVWHQEANKSIRDWLREELGAELCKGVRISHCLRLNRRPVFNQGHGPIPFHSNVHSNHDLDIIQLFRAGGGNSPSPPEGGGDGGMRAENWRDFQDESAVGQHCYNWVSSPEPLDTLVDPMLNDCPRVSAGSGHSGRLQ
ncbi:protein FAM172A isoform X1 [Labeo rohita]|uniref:Protein FAM172A isoform X1 n=1 Tax=Labeo rohita TaxID=84645 RepID=A0A498NPV6_LABRO|nr:protein FAM172A isoform X1 [Labeo rohita]